MSYESQSKSSAVVHAVSQGSRTELTGGSSLRQSITARGTKDGKLVSAPPPGFGGPWALSRDRTSLEQAGPVWPGAILTNCLEVLLPSYLLPPGPKTSLSLAIFLSLVFCFHFLLTRSDRHKDGAASRFLNCLTSP